MTTAARAAALRGSLAHNRALTDELCNILGNFDQRMGRLEEAILPVQARACARGRAWACGVTPRNPSAV
jgi:hypothetical protein